MDGARIDAIDLIITRPERSALMLDNIGRVKVGDLALEAGRPPPDCAARHFPLDDFRAGKCGGAAVLAS